MEIEELKEKPKLDKYAARSLVIEISFWSYKFGKEFNRQLLVIKREM